MGGGLSTPCADESNSMFLRALEAIPFTVTAHLLATSFEFDAAIAGRESARM
jgi:hypothetical protein